MSGKRKGMSASGRRVVGSVIVALALGGLFAASSWADDDHEKATGVVKERISLMKLAKQQMKLLGAINKKEAPYDAAAVAQASHVLAKAGARIPALFPAGSGGEPSEALPAVWSQWDKFKGLASDLEATAKTLGTATEATLPEAVASVGKVCGTCHKAFRKDD